VNPPLIEVNDLTTVFYEGDKFIRAVDGVSFTINRGEIFGVLGESGSGKTVTALSMIGLPGGRPGVIRGSVKIEGREMFGQLHRYCTVSEAVDGELTVVIDDLKWARHLNKVMKQVRGRTIGMIFQEPSTSLDPYFKIRTQMKEFLIRKAGINAPDQIHARSVELLQLVGLDPDEVLDAYPGKLSGGQCQRVMIACVMAGNPKLLIADEPTTYLDPITQIRILDLLVKLVKQQNVAVMLITHDMDVLAKYAGRLMVMFAGHVMEYGSRAAILSSGPGKSHPYTLMLRRMAGEETQGEGGKMARMAPRGCPYRFYCPQTDSKCADPAGPPFVEVGPNHWVSCWLCN